MRWFWQSCLCAHQGLVLSTWMSSLTVGLDRGSHCTAPLILWLSPQCLLGPVQEAVTALRDHEDRTVAQECPVFHFVKVKQHSALMTDPNSPFRTTFSRAVSGARSFLLAPSSWLPWQLWDVAGVAVALFLYGFVIDHTSIADWHTEQWKEKWEFLHWSHIPVIFSCKWKIGWVRWWCCVTA